LPTSFAFIFDKPNPTSALNTDIENNDFYYVTISAITI
jgi:hypothetical protein